MGRLARCVVCSHRMVGDRHRVSEALHKPLFLDSAAHEFTLCIFDPVCSRAAERKHETNAPSVSWDDGKWGGLQDAWFALTGWWGTGTEFLRRCTNLYFSTLRLTSSRYVYLIQFVAAQLRGSTKRTHRASVGTTANGAACKMRGLLSQDGGGQAPSF